MSVPASTAVLVAGGGPAGLAAVAELSLHGIECLAVEPRPQVSHRRPRAKTTSIQTMEHLRRWRVARQLRAAAPLKVAWSQRVTFCESLSGRRITDLDNAFGLTTRRDSRFAEPGQQVPQPVVEEVLRQHLSTPPPSGLAARTRRDRAGAGRGQRHRHHPRRRRQRVSGTGSLPPWLRWRGRRCPGPDRRAVCGPVIVTRPDHVVAWCGEAVPGAADTLLDQITGRVAASCAGADSNRPPEVNPLPAKRRRE
jgi:hypothetical protein